MKCNQNPDLKCNNEDFHRCKQCKAQALCLCQRPERIKAIKKLWEQAEGGKQNEQDNLMPEV